MKKLRMFLLALALTVPALMAPASASAKVVLNQRETLTLLLTDSCTGESVTVTGEIHSVIRSRTGKDGTTHLDIHVDGHGEGVGNDSGNEYVWNELSELGIDNPVGCEFSLSVVRYVRLVSKGPDENRMLKTTFGFSSDANCVLTGGSTFELKCNG